MGCGSRASIVKSISLDSIDFELLLAEMVVWYVCWITFIFWLIDGFDCINFTSSWSYTSKMSHSLWSSPSQLRRPTITTLPLLILLSFRFRLRNFPRMCPRNIFSLFFIITNTRHIPPPSFFVTYPISSPSSSGILNTLLFFTSYFRPLLFCPLPPDTFFTITLFLSYLLSYV